MCAATCVLIALNALPLVLQLDSSSPTYLVLQLHPELSEDHEAIFVILSFLLLLAAGVNIVPLKSPLPRLFFLLTFSSTFARTLILFGFPLALNTNSPHHGIFQLPWLYCYLISFAGSFIAVQSSMILKPKNEMKENNDNDYIGSIFFLAFTSLPFLALAWSTITRTNEENLYGIIWIAAMCNGLLTVSVRSSEVNKDLKVRGGNGSGSGSGDDKRNDTTATTTSICVLSSVSGIVWTILASIITKSVSSDLTVPISCLLLLCVRRNLFNIDIHPFALSATASSFWWMTSSFYSIFFRGYAGSIGVDHFELNVGVFGDENVSIWNNDNLWYPGLNLVLILVPLPAIYLGVIRRKGESEDVLFIFALLSVLSIVAAQCSSIRLLGVAGVAFGSWRCYDVGQIQADSNRLI